MANSRRLHQYAGLRALALGNVRPHFGGRGSTRLSIDHATVHPAPFTLASVADHGCSNQRPHLECRLVDAAARLELRVEWRWHNAAELCSELAARTSPADVADLQRLQRVEVLTLVEAPRAWQAQRGNRVAPRPDDGADAEGAEQEEATEPGCCWQPGRRRLRGAGRRRRGDPRRTRLATGDLKGRHDLGIAWRARRGGRPCRKRWRRRRHRSERRRVE